MKLVGLEKLKMAKINNGVPELGKKEFENHISKGIVIIDFFADWCMPCVMMAPVIEELSGKLKGKVKFGKVNVDDNSEISGKFKVMSIPTLIIFQNGKEKGRITGAMQIDVLEEKLKKFL